MESAFPMSANPPSDTLPFGDAHEALVHARRSVRAYRPDPVPDALLHQLLQSARRAPSGGNLQPGQFTQVRGSLRDALTQALLADWQGGAPEREDYGYFRSEEHTSELQSQSNLVCRLLLEKKKKIQMDVDIGHAHQT